MRRLDRMPEFRPADHARPLRHGRISRVCVAVDTTAAAESAVRLAIAVVRGNYHADIDFCHVINTQRMVACADRTLDDYGLSFDVAHDAARTALDRSCELAHAAGVFARSYIRFGDPVLEAQTFARGRGADLLVIGNRPTEKLHRLLNGSTRDDMVRSCGLPLLVAPRNATRASDFDPRCIVVADASAPAMGAAKRLAADLAADYMAQLVVLPGGTSGASGDKRAIDAAIREHAPGLIVIGVPRTRGIRNVFVDDVPERAMQTADVPLLFVRNVDSCRTVTTIRGAAR